MAEITKLVADFVTRTTYKDLPGAVVQKIKQTLLDSVGCALGGYVIDRSKIAIELVKEQGGYPQATIIGNGKTSYTLAAFANGELINALDYEGAGPLTPHVGTYAMPACLSMAERAHASGKDLITALAIGYETGGRVGSSVAPCYMQKDSPPYYELSPRFSYTSSIFGAVAGTGKILRFDNNQMTNALGIAGASTPLPGGVKFEQTPGNHMTKYNCWAGWVAQLATVAALAAERGFTGDTTILDGEWGYWKMYGSPFFKVDNVISGLGKVWHLEEMRFKRFPCCGAGHLNVDAINKIMLENQINPDDVERIKVIVGSHLMTPNKSLTEIKNVEDTQFCAAAAFALAVYYGRNPGPFWALTSTWKDPKITRLMKKIKVEEDPNAQADMTNRMRAGKMLGIFAGTVEINAKGKKYIANTHSDDIKPMTGEELIAKFRNNADYSALKSEKVERVIETIGDLENVTDINALMKLLTNEDCCSP